MNLLKPVGVAADVDQIEKLTAYSSSRVPETRARTSVGQFTAGELMALRNEIAAELGEARRDAELWAEEVKSRRGRHRFGLIDLADVEEAEQKAAETALAFARCRDALDYAKDHTPAAR
ncbi:MAG: hypothetical protein JWQ18_1564 [Conexibacter sp.]|nr:hypothetical protein [Conexibacter sp.]